jgi:hypothetical protein
MDIQGTRVLCCGYVRPTQHARQGTTAYVVVAEIEDRLDDGWVPVVITDRRGRQVFRWEDLTYLAAFRVQILLPDDPALRDRRLRRDDAGPEHAVLLQKHKKALAA